VIVDADADRRFRALAARRGLDPDARFLGRYVDWEWSHARHVFDGAVEAIAGRRVLELGCNVGATAIVLASLGAEVTAIDPDADLVELARLNAARYGLDDRIAFAHVPDTTRLRDEPGGYDWVSCNSVLEYVPAAALAGVLREVDRVLRPGGVAAVLGSSNRLWPREQHSRRWLVNYVPRRLDALFPGGPPRRGITSRAVRAVLRDYDDLGCAQGGRLFLALKERMGAARWKLAAVAGAGRPLSRLGISLGCLAPTLTLLLRKR
jgi:SAM-dependent methyltransferase